MGAAPAATEYLRDKCSLGDAEQVCKPCLLRQLVRLATCESDHRSVVNVGVCVPFIPPGHCKYSQRRTFLKGVRKHPGFLMMLPATCFQTLSFGGLGEHKEGRLAS